MWTNGLLIHLSHCNFPDCFIFLEMQSDSDDRKTLDLNVELGQTTIISCLFQGTL